jgi:hypothetical protein
MKLISLLEKIGFGQYTSKGVDDVVVDKFEDFGVYVGQLYQKFLNKDLSSDPAIAQKIINMVDFSDSSDLSKEIKDLEFLVNQLPDKPEPTGKIGFKEIADELYLEEFKGKRFIQDAPNEFAYLDFKKWAYPRRGKIKQRLQAVLDNNQANPDTPFFKELAKIWVIWADENAEAFGLVNPTDMGQNNFGRALAVMMKNDNLIIDKESNELLGLKEDDRSEKDKEFDLAQQLSKLTKDDREKLKKIQQMIGKEKNINEILVKYLKENLRNWFKKEDWVRIDTQGNIAGKCGTMKKGKATQRCLPRAKANRLTKKQRAATARKKVAGSKKGKQFVKNTPKAKVKLKK